MASRGTAEPHSADLDNVSYTGAPRHTFAHAQYLCPGYTFPLGSHPSFRVVTQQTNPPQAFRTPMTKGARLPCPPVTTKLFPRALASP